MKRPPAGRGLVPCTPFTCALIVFTQAIFAVTPAGAAERETQWVLIKGSDVPTAVFLSWDYSAVIFRVTCDPKTRELVMRLYNDPEVKFTEADVMSLGWGEDRRLPLKTSLDESGLEARILANSPALAPFLRDRGQKDIDAPNAMEEPFYVGEASELQQVARACR